MKTEVSYDVLQRQVFPGTANEEEALRKTSLTTTDLLSDADELLELDPVCQQHLWIIYYCFDEPSKTF